MDRQTRRCLDNWIIKVESTEEKHQEIILSTIANRARRVCEERGCKHGFELADWLTAEQELCRDDFMKAPPVFTFSLTVRGIQR